MRKHAVPEVPDDAVIAPWEHEVVQALAIRQGRSDLHPYTCPADGKQGSSKHSDRRILRAVTMGWVCEFGGCGYRQTWAHEADTLPEHPVQSPTPID